MPAMLPSYLRPHEQVLRKEFDSSSTAMFTDTRTGIALATRNWSISKGKLHMRSGCRRKSRQVFSTQVLSVQRPAKQRPRSGAQKNVRRELLEKNVSGQRFKTFSFSLQKRFRPFLVWPWNIFSLVLGFAACYWPLTRSLRKCNGHDSIQCSMLIQCWIALLLAFMLGICLTHFTLVDSTGTNWDVSTICFPSQLSSWSSCLLLLFLDTNMHHPACKHGPPAEMCSQIA